MDLFFFPFNRIQINCIAQAKVGFSIVRSFLNSRYHFGSSVACCRFDDCLSTEKVDLDTWGVRIVGARRSLGPFLYLVDEQSVVLLEEC